MTATIQAPAITAESSSRPAKSSFYRPELDVLRFFAFLAVFLYHFTRPTELYVQHGVPRVIAAVGNALMQGGDQGPCDMQLDVLRVQSGPGAAKKP